MKAMGYVCKCQSHDVRRPRIEEDAAVEVQGDTADGDQRVSHRFSKTLTRDERGKLMHRWCGCKRKAGVSLTLVK